MSPDFINAIRSKLPVSIIKGLEKIPPKDQPGIFAETFGHLNSVPDEIDEELLTDIERAVRYLDAKIRLVRMMLAARIRDDGWDVIETESIVMDIFKKFSSGEFYKAYEKFYQGKTLDELGIAI